MGSIFLSRQELEYLKKLYQEEELEEVEKEAFLEQSGIVQCNQQGEIHLSDTAFLVLRTVLAHEGYMEVHKNWRGIKEEYVYFLKEDYIVREEKQEEGSRFLTLPAISYVIGSVADLLWDLIGGKDECQILFIGYGENGQQESVLTVKTHEGRECFEQENSSEIFYDRDSRAELVNHICRWILYKHRELIQRKLKREQL